jgi:hypothetical protein
MYDGPDVMSIKMLEPSDLDYELLVLDIYKQILTATFADNQARFEEFEGTSDMPPHRLEFVKIYKSE